MIGRYRASEGPRSDPVEHQVLGMGKHDDQLFSLLEAVVVLGIHRDTIVVVILIQQLRILGRTFLVPNEGCFALGSKGPLIIRRESLAWGPCTALRFVSQT
jgi:hypothetical protein